MGSFFVILYIACAVSLAGSQTTRTPRSALESIVDERDCQMLKGDYSSKFGRYDFGRLCIQNQSWRLGFIGDKYQRFDIYFFSIKKDTVNPYLYRVDGKTRVKANICDFQGTMTLTAIRKIVDPEACENPVHPKTQGIALFNYSFRENPDQKFSGVFEGNAAVSWYLDSRGRLRYDDLWGCADGFINCAFVGTWKDYNVPSVKVCNWGDSRIPNSGDLDDGAGEFHPADKYSAYGWGSYDADTTAWWK